MKNKVIIDEEEMDDEVKKNTHKNVKMGHDSLEEESESSSDTGSAEDDDSENENDKDKDKENPDQK